jgi:DNA-binding MarR family transcriptional regulator
VTGLIDRLAERGLVERRVATDDRRINQLFLTVEADELFAQILPQAELSAERVLSALTDEERETLRALLTKVEMALK